MMEDIYKHDNPSTEIPKDSAPYRCYLCSHDICPIRAADEIERGWSERNGLVGYDKHDHMKWCAMFKPKALSTLNFLSRMGVCASAIFALCTVFQVHPAVTALFACSTVTFWQLWRWLEGKKAL